MHKYLLIIVIVFVINVSKAQTPQDNVEKVDHKHGEWEIGMAVGAIPLVEENEVALGLHLHILKNIDRIRGLHVGIGFENVIDEHKHYNTGVVLNYNLIKGLFVSYSPGILFIKQENSWEKGFSSHFELSYEFEFKNIHFGPLLEYSMSKYDKHYMIGVHTGLSF